MKTNRYYSGGGQFIRISNPEEVADETLRKLSLSRLSYALDVKTPSSLTIRLYLRWLELQMECKTKPLLLWISLLHGWIDSLYGRGCPEAEIVSEVEKWKESSTKTWREDRPLPNADEIRRVFKGEKRLPARGQDTSQENELKRTRGRERNDTRSQYETYRPTDPARRKAPREDRSYDTARQSSSTREKFDFKYDGPPPANYICNRCKKKGHFLEMCPTNLDPSFDFPPPLDYECGFCFKRGVHWKSLCPWNTNPFSIYMQRKGAHVEPPRSTERTRTSYHSSGWGDSVGSVRRDPGGYNRRDPNEGRLSRPNLFDQSSAESRVSNRTSTREKIRGIDDTRKKLYNEESIDMRDTLAKRDTPNSHKRYRDVEATYDHYEPDTRNTPTRGFDLSSQWKKFRHSGFEPEHKAEVVLSEPPTRNDSQRDASPDPFIMNENEIRLVSSVTRQSSHEMSEHDSNEDMSHREGFRRSPAPPLSPYAPKSDTSDNMDVDEVPAPVEAPKAYHQSLLELISRRGEMSEIVNPRRKRPTALDMWNQDDEVRKEKQKERAAKANEQISEDEKAKQDMTEQNTPPHTDPSNERGMSSQSGESVYYEAQDSQMKMDGANERVLTLRPQKKIRASRRGKAGNTSHQLVANNGRLPAIKHNGATVNKAAVGVKPVDSSSSTHLESIVANGTKERGLAENFKTGGRATNPHDDDDDNDAMYCL